MSRRVGSTTWYETHPSAPSLRDLALDALQDAIAGAGTPNQDPVPCRVLTIPGELCSVCWTDHDGQATTTTEGTTR